MSLQQQMVEALRGEGCRLTPQRLMILSSIEESQGHFSAEAIYERVHAAYPYIDMSTIYRTLQLLRRVGIVTESNLGSGVTQYELKGPDKSGHHHMVCRQCGQSTAFEDWLMEPVYEGLRREFGFESTMEHIAVFGTCARCLEQGERPSSEREVVASEH